MVWERIWLQLQRSRLSERAAALQLSILLSYDGGPIWVGRFAGSVSKVRSWRCVFIALLLDVIQIQFANYAGALTTGVILIGLGAGSEYGLLPYFITRFFV